MGTLGCQVHECPVLKNDDADRGECLTCGLGRDVHRPRLLHPEAGHVPEEGKGACSLLQVIDCN